MEYCSKSEITDAHKGREHIPINCLPENFLWMKVNRGSKMRNLLCFAITAFEDERVVLWTGTGPAVIKAISCAEIMKRKYKTLHQITRVCFHRYGEMWKPTTKEQDELVVDKQDPTIHIMLSRDPLDSNQLGYQGPEILCSSNWKKKPAEGGKEGVNIKKRKLKIFGPVGKSPGKSADQQNESSASPQTYQKSNDKKKRKLNTKKKKNESNS